MNFNLSFFFSLYDFTIFKFDHWKSDVFIQLDSRFLTQWRLSIIQHAVAFLLLKKLFFIIQPDLSSFFPLLAGLLSFCVIYFMLSSALQHISTRTKTYTQCFSTNHLPFWYFFFIFALLFLCFLIFFSNPTTFFLLNLRRICFLPSLYVSYVCGTNLKVFEENIYEKMIRKKLRRDNDAVDDDKRRNK